MNIITIKGVRVYETENRIVYLGLEEVAKELGFTETRWNNTLNQDCKYIMWKRVFKYLKEFGIMSEDKEQFIPENIFYKLCMKAKNDVARKFQDLVCDEILPTIRQTGGYIISNEEDTDEEIMARALLVAQKTIEKKNQKIKVLENKIEENKPKVELADLLLEEDRYFDFEKASKMINIKGWGRNTLYKKFREAGYLDSYNKPYQKYVDAGYFKMVPTNIKRHNGDIIFKTLMSGKVIEKIIKKFKKSIDIK